MTVDAEHVLEPLENAPIIEALCGFHFEPIGELDAMALGEFRAVLRTEYPSHQLQPPLMEGPLSFLPPGEVRLLMTSDDGERVIQVQRDRMYFNWRRVENGEYPRFSDRGKKGVRSLAIDAFERFAEFCRVRFGQAPVVRRCEVAKINHLVEAEHWQDPDDLATLLPAMAPWLRLGAGSVAGFQCGVQSQRANGEAFVNVQSAVRGSVGGVQEKVVVIDLRFHAPHPQEASLLTSLDRANTVVDDLFISVIPTTQHTRFARKN